MTLVNSTFIYGLPPRESAFGALDHIRQIYGVWQITYDGGARTILVEFDASRLTEDDVSSLLRAAGFDIRQSVRGSFAA